MGNGSLERFLGGSPLAVLIRLAFASLLVGAVMAFLGLTPRRIFDAAMNAIRWLGDLGFGTVSELGQWLLAGAAIVVPIWLLARLLAARK